MSAARYERKTLKDVIRDAIYDAMISGELKPGDRIIEMEWAARFSASQAPVREAIRDLEARGVLDVVPYKGAVVRLFEQEKMKEIHAIRGGLEAAALTKVIKTVSDEDVSFLKAVFDEMVKAAEAGDVRTFLDRDIEFHEKIVDLANMPDLKKMWNMCNIRLWTGYSTRFSKLDLIALAKNHEAVYRKIKARDLTEIFETISNHFNIVNASMREEAETATN